ncbi:MAG TPA: hypothetical protein VF595_08740 [Tepidisphaeraceae bacterium]
MSHFLKILGLVSLAASGCASNDRTSERPAAPQAPVYLAATASALAFDPPVALGQPMPTFARDGRGPAAFAGYEQAVTTYTTVQQRDEIRVRNDSGIIERRAYTDRTSITTR